MFYLYGLPIWCMCLFKCMASESVCVCVLNCIGYVFITLTLPFKFPSLFYSSVFAVLWLTFSLYVGKWNFLFVISMLCFSLSLTLQDRVFLVIVTISLLAQCICLLVHVIEFRLNFVCWGSLEQNSPFIVLQELHAYNQHVLEMLGWYVPPPPPLRSHNNTNEKKRRHGLFVCCRRRCHRRCCRSHVIGAATVGHSILFWFECTSRSLYVRL